MGEDVPDVAIRTAESTPTVVVRFRVPGEMAQVLSGELQLSRQQRVIVESDRGPALATVLLEPDMSIINKPLGKVLRVATEADERVEQHNRQREAEAFVVCRERIVGLKLPMKLISVEFSHTGSQAVFYFTSDDRVDFRNLVRELARRFHTRIEMRQIGVRDAARHIGGIGVCGRELCCSSWLPEFKPVSIRMAKDQNLSLNHDKLSGACGRLRCCLRYEQEMYHEARKGLPKLGKKVVTSQGEGRVRDINVLKRTVRVQLDAGGMETFGADEVARPPEAQRKKSPPKQLVQELSAEIPAVVSTTTGPSTDALSDENKPPRRRRRRRRSKAKSNKPGGGDADGS
ncbi:MAG: stage 0 sporulation family protein [Myxococcota bacterium]